MTIKLASLKADLAREARGDWIDFPDWPGVAFNVSSLFTEPYATDRDLMMQRLAAKYPGKPVPREEMLKELGVVYHQHILHDWRGLDVPYSREAALEVLTDPAYRDFIAAIEWCANRLVRPSIEFIDAHAKNSEAPSAGV